MSISEVVMVIVVVLGVRQEKEFCWKATDTEDKIIINNIVQLYPYLK